MLFFFSGLPIERVIEFPNSHIRAQCPIHFILLDPFALILSHHSNIIRSSSLRTFSTTLLLLRPLCTSSILSGCAATSLQTTDRGIVVWFLAKPRDFLFSTISRTDMSFLPQDRIQISLGGGFFYGGNAAGTWSWPLIAI